MNKYVPGTIPGVDPRTARMIQELYERTNQLQDKMDLVAESIPPVGAMKENPTPGVLTIPPTDPGGQGGFIRVSKDGVIQSYTNPVESIFPYVDITVVGNINAGLDQLHTFTLPANTLAQDGYALWVRYGGVFAANGNDKRIQIEFGGVAFHNTGLFGQDLGSWVYDIIYLRTSPTIVKQNLHFEWHFISRDGAGTMAGNGISGCNFLGQTVANLNTNDMVLRVMAEGTATDDIQQGLSHISLLVPRTVKLV